MDAKLLSCSNDFFSVVLPNLSYSLGSNLSGSVKLSSPTSSSRYTSFKVSFKGLTSFIPKFDPGLGSALAFYQNFNTLKHVFIDSEEITLSLPSDKSIDSIDFQLKIPDKFNCKCFQSSDPAEIQEFQKLTLPDCPPEKASYSDSAETGVVYQLEVVGVRKGMFKRNEILNVAIPFAGNRSLEVSEISQPRESTIKALTKFKGPDGKEMMTTIRLSTLPLTSPDLSFRLSFSPSSPEQGGGFISSLNPTIHAYVIRRSLCRQPKPGKVSKAEWRIQFERKTTAAEIRKVRGNEGEEIAYEGKVILRGMETVKGCHVSIDYRLLITIDSPNMIHEILGKHGEQDDIGRNAQKGPIFTEFGFKQGRTTDISVGIFCAKNYDYETDGGHLPAYSGPSGSSGSS